MSSLHSARLFAERPPTRADALASERFGKGVFKFWALLGTHVPGDLLWHSADEDWRYAPAAQKRTRPTQLFRAQRQMKDLADVCRRLTLIGGSTRHFSGKLPVR